MPCGKPYCELACELEEFEQTTDISHHIKHVVDRAIVLLHIGIEIEYYLPVYDILWIPKVVNLTFRSNIASFIEFVTVPLVEDRDKPIICIYFHKSSIVNNLDWVSFEEVEA